MSTALGTFEADRDRVEIKDDWVNFELHGDSIKVMISSNKLVGEIFLQDNCVYFRRAENGPAVSLPFNQGPVIGRRTLPEEVLGEDYGYISSFHCEIFPFMEGESVKVGIRDVGSKNGTFCEVSLPETSEEESGSTILAGGAEGHESANDGNFQILTYLSGGALKEDGSGVNEDSVYMNPKEKVIAVADGMGGHKYGEIASTTVINAVDLGVENKFTSDTIIHNAIRRLALIFPDKKPVPGATLAMAKQYKSGEKTIVECTSVGDAAVIMLHPEHGVIYASTDQTYIQKLFDAGVINDPLERYTNRFNHILMNAVQPPTLQMPPVIEHKYAPPGTYVFTFSDGITDFVTPEEMLEIINLCGKDSPALIKELAESRHGKDKYEIKLEGKIREVELLGADNIAIGMMVVN